MSLETGNRIEDLVDTNPVGATDFVSQGDDHIRLLKACIQGSFPSLGPDAVTATALELNKLAGNAVTAADLTKLSEVTATSTELNYVDGVTSAIQTQLNAITTAITGTFQPLDSDLTAIAALTTTAFGRGFLDLADLAATATKLAALVPTWSGLHTFTNEAVIGKASNGAAAGMIVRNTGSGAGTLTRLSLNDATGNLGYLQGDPAGNSISLRAVDRNDRMDFWTGSAGGAQRVAINQAGSMTINAPVSGVALAVTGVAGSRIAQFNGPSGQWAGIDLIDGNTGNQGYTILSGWPATGDFTIMDVGAAITKIRIKVGGDVYINDSGTERKVGFRGLVVGATFASSYSEDGIANNGRMKRYVGGSGDTVTLQNGEADSLVTIINNGGGPLAIAESLSGVLRWFNGAAATDGARTLAVGGVMSLLWNDSQNVLCWGTGIS